MTDEKAAISTATDRGGIATENMSTLSAGVFFQPDEAAQLCDELKRAPRESSMVGDAAGEYVLRPEARNTSHVDVPARWKQRVRSRIEELRPVLEKQFARRFGVIQKPRFLSYETGEYFKAHRDLVPGPRQPAIVTGRSLSIVVLLNVGQYEGGTLVLHDLGVPGAKVPITGRAGGFVAFHPLVLHEVTPVTKGQRFSIATWLERTDSTT